MTNVVIIEWCVYVAVPYQNCWRMCPSWSQMWAVRSSKSAMGSRVWNVIGDVLCNWRVMEPVRCWGRDWLDWTGAGLYTVVDSRTWAVLQWTRLWTGDWHRGRREAQCRIQSRYAMSCCHCLPLKLHLTTSELPYSLVRSKREYCHNCSLVVVLCSFV